MASLTRRALFGLAAAVVLAPAVPKVKRRRYNAAVRYNARGMRYDRAI